jgi:predicted ATPase
MPPRRPLVGGMKLVGFYERSPGCVGALVVCKKNTKLHFNEAKMKINKFEAQGVNGFLSFDIKFDESLNFLIGINGSGKTTAIKLMLGLIVPSHKYLMKIEYKEAVLYCTNQNNQRIKISSKQIERGIELNLNIAGEELSSMVPYPEIESRIVDEVDEELLAYRKFYQSKVVRRIKQLKSPVYLGLNRSIFQGDPAEDIIRNRNRKEYHIKYNYKVKRRMIDQMDASLLEVQDLVSEYIKETADQQPKITEEFKSKVLQNSIRYIEEDRLSFTTSINSEEFEEKQSSLLAAAKELGLGDFTDEINDFFTKYKDLTDKLNVLESKIHKKNSKKEDEESWSNLLGHAMINSLQLRSIDKLLELSTIYQDKISELREPLERLNSILAEFFSQSKKEVRVLSNGKFQVKLQNGDIAEPTKLSSGEKQILVMITHLVFYEDRNIPGVFIIDEPELSLHLGWQEIFVKAIQVASQKTQFILATHSPTIIGGLHNEQFCINIEQ